MVTTANSTHTFKENNMTESILIKAQDNRTVFVDQNDNDIWLSIQTNSGGAHCVIPRDEADKMVKALQDLIGKME